MLDSAAEFCAAKLFRSNSVSGKTLNLVAGALYPSTQDADATLANLLGFGSNRNFLGAKLSGLFFRVPRGCYALGDGARLVAVQAPLTARLRGTIIEALPFILGCV